MGAREGQCQYICGSIEDDIAIDLIGQAVLLNLRPVVARLQYTFNLKMTERKIVNFFQSKK